MSDGSAGSESCVMCFDTSEGVVADGWYGRPLGGVFVRLPRGGVCDGGVCERECEVGRCADVGGNVCLLWGGLLPEADADADTGAEP